MMMMRRRRRRMCVVMMMMMRRRRRMISIIIVIVVIVFVLLLLLPNLKASAWMCLVGNALHLPTLVLLGNVHFAPATNLYLQDHQILCLSRKNAR